MQRPTGQAAMTPVVKIRCEDRELEAILDGGFYEVPRFQRDFSWTRGNVEDFLGDVFGSEDVDYFIGSIVVFRVRRSRNRFGVVDGQQRLTTATLLLCAIRDAFHVMGDEGRAQGLHSYIQRKDIENRTQFVLSRPDRPARYLEQAIQRFALSKAQQAKAREIDDSVDGDGTSTADPEARALKTAYTAIVDFVGDQLPDVDAGLSASERDRRRERAVRRLVELRDVVLRLKVVWIVVDDEDDAYVIFETLNTRGKDLEVADLVRNHLIQHLRHDEAAVEAAREAWEGILARFTESAADIDVNRFLLHQWLSTESYTSEKKLFGAIRQQIGRNNARRYLSDLERDSELYRSMAEPESAHWDSREASVRRSLEALSIFSVRQPYPMVLSLLRAYRDGGMQLALLRRGLSAIENSYYVATAVAGMPSSGGVSSMFARLARELASAPADERRGVLDELVERLEASQPPLEVFQAEFEELRASERFSGRRRLVLYTLRRLYEQHRKPAHRSAEHLQLASFREEDKNLSDELAASIGNLLLIDDDLAEGWERWGLARRRQELKRQRRFWVPPELVADGTWGKREILKRTESLGREAYEDVFTV